MTAADAARQTRETPASGGRGQLHAGPELPPARRTEQAAALRRAHPGVFPTPETAAHYLRRIHMPASGRWAFLNNGKAGTSSSRRFLFQLEFGVPLTVAWDVPDDINSDAVAHRLQGASGILRPALVVPDAEDRLAGALRLTTVRHPLERALSAFDYICRSHDLRHVWFVQDRLRMNAMVGFDWDRHPRTAEGLARFLAYVEQSVAESGAQSVDPHWRPQIDNILPAIYRPDLIGRLEDMGRFFRDIAERLGQELPEGGDRQPSNRQDRRSDRDALLTPANRRAVARLYAADFDWLGYEAPA